MCVCVSGWGWGVRTVSAGGPRDPDRERPAQEVHLQGKDPVTLTHILDTPSHSPIKRSGGGSRIDLYKRSMVAEWPRRSLLML